jgi:hypothetical protein
MNMNIRHDEKYDDSRSITNMLWVDAGVSQGRLFTPAL